MIPGGVAAEFSRAELWRPIVVVEKTGKRRVGKSVVDRLFSHVVEDGDCWLWTGELDPSGYGRITIQRRGIGAHRAAYMSLIGDIPRGLELDHLCRVRRCVNPWHLEPVTSRINTLRGDSLTRHQADQTHCKRGHELSPANLYKRSDRRRECNICKVAAGYQRRARDREIRDAQLREAS